MSPYLSVVIPVYNEEANLPPLFERLTTVLDAQQQHYEIIFTNDGSRDNSGLLLAGFHAARPDQVRVIEFNRNYGQHQAIMAAFERARGEVIVTLDADLQNPPEEIPKLLAAIAAGHDVVGGYRQLRQDSWFRRNASRLLNRVRERTTKIVMRDQGCMLRAYRRDIVQHITAMQESSTFIPALAMSFASNPAEVAVDHAARASGVSKYRLFDLLRLNFDLMTGFTILPLQIFTMIGMLVSLLSGVFVVYLFIRRLIIGPEAEGLFTLFAILFFLVSLVIFGLGLIGEYVGRIYQRVRLRPPYIVRAVLERDDD